MYARKIIVWTTVLFILCVSFSQASSILIQCNISAATIKIDSKDYGITDENGKAYISDISPGTHEVSVSKERYTTFTKSVTVKKELTCFVKATLLLSDITPPEIKVISPAPSRGIKVVLSINTTKIIGLARDEGDIESVIVNGTGAVIEKPSENELKLLPGNTVKFSGNVTLVPGANTVHIKAVDKNGNESFIDYVIEKEEENIIASLNMECHALLIGIDEYDYWNDLNNPVRDVQALAQDLEDIYGFNTQVVENANKSTILQNIRSFYNQQFKENSQLLIVLAGHGYFDDLSKIGYFVPADGKKPSDDPINESYISYLDLQNTITNFNCKHILLVLDACFSGTFNRQIALRGDTDTNLNLPKREYILHKLKYKTRKVITSGGKEYVSDGDVHSPFVRGFLSGLRNFGGQDGILSIEELMVSYMDALNPSPYLMPFREGDEPGSSFLFIAR